MVKKYNFKHQKNNIDYMLDIPLGRFTNFNIYPFCWKGNLKLLVLI